MKKNLKLGLVFLIAAAMLLCLCGCSALDEMRKNQAFYDEEGNILWNGAVYKQLPECESLYIDYNYNANVYLTETDVPVLLSDVFAQDTLSASLNGSFLCSFNGERVLFCREDLYENLLGRIQGEFVPDIVCYSYDVYNEETYEYETKYYTLTQEQVDVIHLVIETTDPTTMGDGMHLDSDWSLYLEECSEDMLFRRNTVDISLSGATYYLHLYTGEDELLFTVPEGCNAAFDGIVSAFVEANSYWDGAYEDAL